MWSPSQKYVVMTGLAVCFPETDERDSHGCPGENCDCKAYTIKYIGTGDARDESWLMEHQSERQTNYAFRVHSTRLAMLRDGIYIPNRFEPSNYRNSNQDCTPEGLFPENKITFSAFPGFTPYRFALGTPRPVGPPGLVKMQLICTDGACSDNGRYGAKAAAGFAFSNIGRENTRGCVSLPLEREGPDGNKHTPTSNRAELRAVIAALEWRRWYLEGWDALVIATDSTYVVNGSTTWVSAWIDREWNKANGSKAANKDLWKHLLRLFREYAIHGCEVMMWHIPRSQNQLADKNARRGLEFDSKDAWASGRDPMLDIDTVFDFGAGNGSRNDSRKRKRIWN